MRVLGVLLLSGFIQAALLAQSVTVNYLYPTTSGVLETNGTQAITAAGATFYTFGSILQTVVTPSSITITNPTGITALMDTVSFDGPQYVYPAVGSNAVTIIGVAIDPASNVAGFDMSDITFASHEVRVNLQNLVLTPDFNIKLNHHRGSYNQCGDCEFQLSDRQPHTRVPDSSTDQYGSAGAIHRDGYGRHDESRGPGDYRANFRNHSWSASALAEPGRIIDAGAGYVFRERSRILFGDPGRRPDHQSQPHCGSGWCAGHSVSVEWRQLRARPCFAG